MIQRRPEEDEDLLLLPEDVDRLLPLELLELAEEVDRLPDEEPLREYELDDALLPEGLELENEGLLPLEEEFRDGAA